MAEVFSGIARYLNGVYDSITSSLGGSAEGLLLFKMIFFVILLTLTALFIWRFYNSLSNRDLVLLNLSQYNTSSHPVTSKFFAIVLYLLEYIILAPIMIFIWSAALSIILLMVAKQRSIDEVLIISVAMVGAVRLLAYFKKEIAVDLAKLFPLTILVVFLLEPGSLNITQTISQLAQVPTLLSSLVSFLLVVFVIELFLRVIYTIYDFWFSEDEAEEQRSRKQK